MEAVHEKAPMGHKTLIAGVFPDTDIQGNRTSTRVQTLSFHFQDEPYDFLSHKAITSGS